MNKDNLNDLLLNAEVEKIKSETKANINKIWIERFKLLSLIVVSIVVFYVIRQPGYILSKKDTEESIARERTKRMLNWVKEDDISKKRLALKIIKSSYFHDQDWFDEFDEILESEMKNNVSEYIYQQIAHLYEIMYFKNENLNIHKEILKYFDFKDDEDSIQKEILKQISKLKSLGKNDEEINIKIALLLENIQSGHLYKIKKLSKEKMEID